MFVGTSVGSYPADIRRKVTDFETRAAFEGVAALSACDEELEMTAGVGNVFWTVFRRGPGRTASGETLD